MKIMKQVLFIRPAAEADGKTWWCESGSGEVGFVTGLEALSTLSELPSAKRVCLLLPASEMIFRRFMLAKKGVGSKRTPFSWMAEETLIGDVDALHWTVLAKKGQQVDVVAIASERLQFWLEHCQQAGLTVIQALPDAILLPGTENGCTVVPLESSYWLRMSPFAACECDLSLLPLLVQKQKEADVHYYGVPPEGIEVTTSQAWQHPLVLIQPQWKSCKANMLHGAFGARRETLDVKGLKKWALAGGIFLVVAMLAPQALTAWLMVQKANALQDEIQTLCQHHFPTMTQKSNIKYHFGQNVKKEKKGFFMQLDTLNEMKMSQPSLEVDSIDYDAEKQQVTLQVHAQDSQALQRFVDQSSERFNFTMQPLSSEAPYTAMITGTQK